MGILNIIHAIKNSKNHECEACKVRKEWNISQESAIERQRLIYEARIEHLEKEIRRAQEERKELEQTILRFTRVIPSVDFQRTEKSSEPVRVGTPNWSTRKAQLEKDAFDKANYWLKKKADEDAKNTESA